MKLSKSGLKAVKEFLLAMAATLIVIALLTIATVYLPIVWVVGGWLVFGITSGIIYMYHARK